MERELKDICQKLGLVSVTIEFSIYSRDLPFGAYLHWDGEEATTCAYGAGATVEAAVQEARAKMLTRRVGYVAPLKQVA